jgi:hypothetical protein
MHAIGRMAITGTLGYDVIYAVAKSAIAGPRPISNSCDHRVRIFLTFCYIQGYMSPSDRRQTHKINAAALSIEPLDVLLVNSPEDVPPCREGNRRFEWTFVRQNVAG